MPCHPGTLARHDGGQEPDACLQRVPDYGTVDGTKISDLQPKNLMNAGLASHIAHAIAGRHWSR